MEMYGLLLAGGKSSRMGQDKAELQICGVSLLQQGEEVLSHSLCQQVLISRNCGAGIKDRFSGLGPLAGIDAAIQQIDDGAWLTVMPVDMPLISAEHLIELQQQAMVTEQACYFANFMLPCVVQVTTALRRYLIERLISQQQLSIRALLSHINAQSISAVSDHYLINTNTPHDWHAVQNLI